MAQIGLEDIYPEEVAAYGHMRVGVTQELVREQYVVKGVTTQGELRDTTRRLLRDDAVQMQVSERLAALPDGYDPGSGSSNGVEPCARGTVMSSVKTKGDHGA